jgi:Lipase (class 3)
MTKKTWTTTLGFLLSLHPTSISIEKKRDIMMEYEAFLCQCAYMSRLAYTPAEIMCRMIPSLDVSPDIFNDCLTLLEEVFYNHFPYDMSYNSLALSNENTLYKRVFEPSTILKDTNTKRVGYFLQNEKQLNAYMYVYDNPKSRILSLKTLYITFKGSSSVKDFKHDLSFIPSSLNNLYGLEQEVKDLLSHQGFISVLKPSIKDLMIKANEFVRDHGVQKIVITGHSLGGALATLTALCFVNAITCHFKDLSRYREIADLANLIHTQQPIHLVTFGAPCLFTDRSRVFFNQFLLDGLLTLDRVDSSGKVNANVITVLPPGLVHPGFQRLRTEVQPYKKTGRTDQLGELRNKVFGLPLSGRFANNDFYLEGDFLSYFTTMKSSPTIFLEHLKHVGGTWSESMNRLKGYILPDLYKTYYGEIITPFPPLDLTEFKQNGGTIKRKKKQKSKGGVTLSSGPYAAMYKKETLEQMPNHLVVNCYTKVCGGFCHGAYMGVGFMDCIRVPKISTVSGTMLMRKKEPRQDYQLVLDSNSKRPYSIPLSSVEPKNAQLLQVKEQSPSSSFKQACTIL